MLTSFMPHHFHNHIFLIRRKNRFRHEVICITEFLRALHWIKGWAGLNGPFMVILPAQSKNLGSHFRVPSPALDEPKILCTPPFHISCRIFECIYIATTNMEHREYIGVA
jgi:hypothetical protein